MRLPVDLRLLQPGLASDLGNGGLNRAVAEDAAARHPGVALNPAARRPAADDPDPLVLVGFGHRGPGRRGRDRGADAPKRPKYFTVLAPPVVPAVMTFGQYRSFQELTGPSSQITTRLTMAGPLARPTGGPGLGVEIRYGKGAR